MTDGGLTAAGTTTSLSAFVIDATFTPVDGIDVTFQVFRDDDRDGPLDSLILTTSDLTNDDVDDDGDAVIEEPGQASLDYAGPAFAANDDVIGCLDLDNDGCATIDEFGSLEVDPDEGTIHDRGFVSWYVNEPTEVTITGDSELTINGTGRFELNVRNEAGEGIDGSTVRIQVFRDPDGVPTQVVDVEDVTGDDLDDDGEPSDEQVGEGTFDYDGPATPIEDLMVACIDADEDGCAVIDEGFVVIDEDDVLASLQVEWFDNTLDDLTVQAGDDTPPAGTEADIVATVFNGAFDGVDGVDVRFDVYRDRFADGTVDSFLFSTTDVTGDDLDDDGDAANEELGEATLDYTGPAFPALDHVVACIDDDGDERCSSLVGDEVQNDPDDPLIASDIFRWSLECTPVARTIFNGDPAVDEGALRVEVDGLGAFGSATNGGNAVFNPVSELPAASTTFSSNLFVSTPVDDLLDDDCGNAAVSVVSSSDTRFVTSASFEQFSLRLAQQVDPIGLAGSRLVQTYEFTNTSGGVLPLTLVRHIDGDLFFAGGFTNDGGAANADGSELFEFDAVETPLQPSTFVSIAGDADADSIPDRWTLRAYDYRPTIRAENAIPVAHNGLVSGDNNGDRITDIQYDVTMSQQWDVSIADGQTLTFTTLTRFGERPANLPPIARPDSLTVAEDDADGASVDVLANDEDPDVDPLTVTGNSDPANGSATCTLEGICTYIPDPDYFGSDSFTYSADDGRGLSSNGTVNVTVSEVNDAPVADDDEAGVTESESVLVDVLAGDVAGPPNESTQQLTISQIIDAPTKGTATIESGQIRYAANDGASGTDTLTYEVCDDGTTNGSADVRCDTATVTMTITPQPRFTLTVIPVGEGTVTSSPVGIDCDPDCSELYLQNTIVGLTATPDAGWQFDGWSGDCTGTGACSVTMSADQNVTATFSEIPTTQFDLAVTVFGQGVVTSSPASIDCEPTCSAAYDDGTVVGLTATPDAGWQFDGWSGDCTGTGACSVTMSADQNVTATFSEIPTTQFDLAVTVFGQGVVTSSPASIDCEPTCSAAYDDGTVVGLTATPDAGWQFDGWSGDCTGTGACSVTMSADRNVTATFSDIPTTQFDLAVTVFGQGVVTSSPAGIDCEPTCSAAYDDGTVVDLTATPDAGWQFDGWSGDCTGTGPCSVTMSADRNVTATFSEIDGENQPPVADDDEVSTSETRPLTIFLDGLAFDPDFDPLTFAVTNEVDHGVLECDTDGFCTYTPAIGFSGTDQFTYEVDDGNGGTDTGVVTITVDPCPVLVDAIDDGNIATGQAWIACSAVDANGTVGSVTPVFGPVGPDAGLLTSGDRALASQPNNNSGAGRNNGTELRGALDVSILRIDLDIPVGTNCLAFDLAFMSEEYPEFVGQYNDAFLAELDRSTWSVDGNTITAPDNFAFDQGGGVVSVNSAFFDPDRVITDTGIQYDGSTARLRAQTPITSGPHAIYLSIFDANDHILDSAAFVDNLLAGVKDDCEAGANQPPVARDDDGLAVPEDGQLDIDVLGNDEDFDEDPILITNVSDPANGAATILTKGTADPSDDEIRYVPDPDYFGPDSFTYSIADGRGGVDTATVSLTVTPVNDPPVADDETATTDENVPVNIDVAPGDIAGPANESAQTLTFSVETQPSNGSATCTAAGVCTYTPAAGFSGSDSFAYEVCDNGQTNGSPDPRCDTATVSVTVDSAADVFPLDVTVVGQGNVTSTPAGIDCGNGSTDCTESYEVGSSVVLGQTAAAGWQFAGWSGACTGTGTCTVTMDGPREVTATFTQTDVNLTVQKAGTGGGTVTGTGINCGPDCTQAYPVGTQVTLTATPDASSVFGGWSVAGCSGTTCTFTMSADRTVTATFTQIVTNANLTVQKAGTGGGTVTGTGINCGPDCTQAYPVGTQVTLTATPDASSVFGGWSVAGCSGTTCTFTMSADRTVTATFTRITASVNDVQVVEGGPGGGVVLAFTISLSQAPQHPVSVAYSLAPGTASAGSDYSTNTTPNSPVSFTAVQTARAVSVPVIGDIVSEPNETLFLNLGAASGAVVADGQGVGTILNDDVCTIVGTNAGETIIGTAGDDYICALGGKDTIAPLGGNDVVNGGAGDDWVTYSTSPAGVSGSLGGTIAGWGVDQMESIQNFRGSGSADTVSGTDGDNEMEGLSGNDNFAGGAGSDWLKMGNGSDRAAGESGADDIEGDVGNDNASSGPGNLLGGSGSDTISGGEGNDAIFGESGDDKLAGNSGNDAIRGGDGNDVLNGNKHTDSLFGDTGNDTLHGGPEAGNFLDGGTGTDFCSFGPGSGDTRVNCEKPSSSAGFVVLAPLAALRAAARIRRRSRSRVR